MSRGLEPSPQQAETSGPVNRLRLGSLAMACGGVEFVAVIASVVTGDAIYAEVAGPVIDAGLVSGTLLRARGRFRNDHAPTSSISVSTSTGYEPVEPKPPVTETEDDAFSSELLDPELEPESREEDTIQVEIPEVSTNVETNRKSAEYLHAFFGIVPEGHRPKVSRAGQVATLARKSDPAAFPRNVHAETREIISQIASLVRGRRERTMTLFDSSKNAQPNGLSVAIVLHKTGFATPTAREQYEINTELDDEGTITTSAKLSGRYYLKADYLHDGVDTRVTLSLVDLNAKPESVAPKYPDGLDPERGRARFRGHEIWTDMEGVSRGRKKGQLPPG